MTNRFAILSVFLFLILALPLTAQDDQQTIFCTLDDGNEISIRFRSVGADKKNEPPIGKPWAPADRPMFLFTPTELTLGNTTIPTGAYSLFLIKNKNDWTLIVNRNVAQNSSYDDKQDIARINMQSSRLPSTGKPFSLTLGHIAPKVCSVQVVYGDMAGWAEFKGK